MLLSGVNIYSQVVDENTEIKKKRSEVIFDRYINYISDYKNLDRNKVLIQTAKFFLGSPYVASTLEQEGPEQLVVNLEEFDCTTFVETCIALTLATVSKELTIDKFEEYLQQVRYRRGVIDGYSSRLHYMIDWVADGELKKIFDNISIQLGGKPIKKRINFMSAHPDLYLKLKDNKGEIEKIAKIEEDLVSKDYTVIPRSNILAIRNAIQTGDIIIFATAIEGLDYSHVGIAYVENDVLKMIHASSTNKKVIVENRSLNEYCKTTRNCTGITILRLKRPCLTID